jgi:3-phenylpropionate/trans-cinnamate dioxygenase ferredoxin reductase subunit
MRETCVIVGAGQCGVQAAASLRENGFQGRIVLIGEERHAPYQRPPLSKGYLAGKLAPERIELRPASFYTERDIERVFGTRVVAIDRAAGYVRLADGRTQGFDKLLLATGSRPRRLQVPGAGLAGVYVLRTRDDADAIRAEWAPGRRLAIIGGGYIGLEVAAVAVTMGLQVTVLEAAERVLSRVTSPQMSAYFEEVHRRRGVEIRCGAAVAGFEGDGRLHAVVCGGERIAADVAVVGIGIMPNVELASEAGLPCDDGIVVDEFCRTADERIFAAGDCTNHPSPLLGRRVRLESVQNATDQAKAAAANLCGKARTYAEVPWFWSHQYDLRLQTVGLVNGYDQIVERGNRARNAFALFYLRDGRLTAVDAVNMPREYMACRRLLPQKACLDLSRLADASVPIQELM